ncbi:unnamed protein product [Caenorhabditis auriculariae]|uniref:Cleavage stimulation factor subunit 2 hinge domain-containing protein n=1 Tax=Caenorhabditis auriculariae TaxID=2777116 RepID=A0A8S1GXF0_9PELO|nr:unnamed protein product [Caenorhabditis auriculariae]
MKEIVRTNPNEIKNMLTANPQLAYALLQAQVVMRIVDPQTAIAMLHRETPTQTTPFHLQGPAQPSLKPQQQQPPPNFGMPPPHAATSSAMPPMQPPFGRPPPNFPPSQPEISPEEQQNADLLLQVMQLKEEEIALLPPGDREKVIELRNQLKRSVR